MANILLTLPYIEVKGSQSSLRIMFKFYHKGCLHTIIYSWRDGDTYLENCYRAGPFIAHFPRPSHNRFILTVLTDQFTFNDFSVYSSCNKEVKDILTPIYGHEPQMSGGWPNWLDYRKGAPWILNTLLPALNNLLAEKYKNLYTFDLSLEDLKTQVKF